MRNLVAAGVVLVGLTAACSGSGNGAAGKDTQAAPPAAAAAASGETCVIGTWNLAEDGVVRSFTFKPDRTGQEVYTASDIRPLKWSLKDDRTIHLVYDAQGETVSTEADIGVDCARGMLGPGYKKQ